MNSKYIVTIAVFAVGTLSHGMQQLQSVASQEAAINGVDETQASKKRKLAVGSESIYENYEEDYSEDAVARQLGAIEAPPELVIGDISEPDIGMRSSSGNDFFSASNSNASTDQLRDCEALDSSMSDVPNLELGDVQEQIVGELPPLLPVDQLAAASIDDSSSSNSNAGVLLAAATVASQGAGSPLGKRKKPSPHSRAPEAPMPSASRGSESSSSESDYSESEPDSDDDYKMTERRKPASKSKKMNKKVFPCTRPGCSKTLKSKAALLGHLQSHARKEKTFKCEHHGCGKVYKTGGTFKNHMLRHTASSSSSSNSNEVEAASDTGKKVIKSPKTVKNDKGKYGYKCTEVGCGVFYGDLKFYTQHMDAHEVLKKYKDWYKQSDEWYFCTFAGCANEPFKLIGNLSNHLRSHDPNLVNSSGTIKTTIVNGKKHFLCDESGCGEDFSTNERLKIHITYHNAIKATGVSVKREDKGWRCLFPGCTGSKLVGRAAQDGLFNKLGNLAAHVKTHVGAGSSSASNSSSSSSSSSSATAMEDDNEDQDE